MDIQHIAAPEAGKDYPRNWNEFLDWFGSEEACLGYWSSFAGPKDSCVRAAVPQASPTDPAVLG